MVINILDYCVIINNLFVKNTILEKTGLFVDRINIIWN